MAAHCSKLAAAAAIWCAAATLALGAPEWEEWGAHPSQCSTTCGQGVRCRRRNCVELSAPGGHPAGVARAGLNMDNCVGGEKAGRECLPCRAYVECPQNGAWGDWTDWTDCQLKRETGAAGNGTAEAVVARNISDVAEGSVQKDTEWMAQPMRGDALDLDPDCGKGNRTRQRSCDNPAPGPSGLLCGDVQDRQQAQPCEVPCTADLDFLGVVKTMLAEDLESSPNQLVYVNHGAPTTLDCENEAYTVALQAVKPYQLLQIQWRRNNDSITSLITLLQKFMQEKEEMKGLLTNNGLKDEAKEKLEPGQLRSVGTKLTIDPVDAKHVGLYGCYMVLDGEHYLMRSFTLLSRIMTVREQKESELVQMPTNTETLISPQLPFMEAAIVRWYHNGLPHRDHLLVDWQQRFWELTLAFKHTGVWECYIVLGSRRWKTNEFQLDIGEEASFMRKFDNQYAGYFFATCALILYAIVGFPLAVLTLRQREDNWITAEEQRCIEFVRQINYLYMTRYVRRISGSDR